MKKNDKDELIDILAKQARSAREVGPAGYFRGVILDADLPPRWQDLKLSWSGIPRSDARELIDWAVAQRTNPQDPRFDTLGSVLRVIIDDLGMEDQRTVAAIILAYRLYHDPDLLDSVAIRYQAPVPASRDIDAEEVGPAFIWRGPADDLELQGWLQPEPDFYDVGFLKRGIEQAAGVCRIELSDGRSGTGFLPADGLLLTNYHVFELRPDDSLQSNVGDAVFRFGYITAEGGDEVQGATVAADKDEPIVSSSPVEELDYVLLRLDPAVRTLEGIKPLRLNSRAPSRNAGLHILQHPFGKEMMVALSTNGITGVYTDHGLFQYVTGAAGGSSGAPCFDDDWNVVGIHHAERARRFGAIREGVLISSIHQGISQYIQG